MTANSHRPFGLRTLQLSILILSGCSLVYEMAVGTALVQLYGDSIYYLTLTVAAFILFMGIGSFLSVYFIKNPLPSLLVTEVLLTVIGGSSVSAVMVVASEVHGAAPTELSGPIVLVVAGCIVAVIGVLTGLEIPLAMALREDGSTEAKGVSRLLSADYVGGLVGSLLFAFLLLPTLEINGAAIAACLGNAVVAVYLASHLPLRRARSWVVFAVTIATLFMAVRFAQKAHEFRKNVDQKIYSRTEDTVIRSNFRTRYQKVVMTTTKYETRKYEWFEVYLNGYIQADAYHASVTDAYHHALVHSAMAISKKRDRVLILGGGDGLPAKEVLKYGNEVKRLVMVDLDGEWVKFSKTNPIMRAHNHNALSHPKLELNISDAFRWVRHSRDVFDLIFVDFPEGVDYPLARSYSVEFLSDLKRLLADGGVAVFQSDTYDDSAYWCIVKTMQASGYDVIPFHTREEEPEGVIFLTKGPADLSTLDAKLARRSFVHRNLAPGRAQLAAARNHTEIRKKTAKVEVNTFYHPVYLTYRRFEQSDDSVISWW